jgi:hypothetical protein
MRPAPSSWHEVDGKEHASKSDAWEDQEMPGLGTATDAPTPTVPTVTFPRLWHVGSLVADMKRRGSLEGACLSVSRHPAAWREISDGMVGGPCWSMDASHMPMLDALALDDALKEAIMAWGVGEGLAAPAVLWRTSSFDDELDDVMTMTFDDRNDAICQLDLDEEDPAYEERVAQDVEEVREHRSTALLNERTRYDGELLGDRSVLDMLLPLWTEANTELHGVWWNERLDPPAYSAPRGGLIATRVDATGFAPAPIEPYDESDHESEDEA